jgi:uncharacterized protein YebE (UPF0316 family)
MFGHPVARVAERLDMPNQIRSVGKGFTRSVAAPDRHEV